MSTARKLCESCMAWATRVCKAFKPWGYMCDIHADIHELSGSGHHTVPLAAKRTPRRDRRERGHDGTR